MAISHGPAQRRFARAFWRPDRLPVAAAGAVAVTAALVAPAAQARITRIDITQSESPTFGGYSWPDVGQYEKIVGVAHGEVNPLDPKNAVITVIALAATS